MSAPGRGGRPKLAGMVGLSVSLPDIGTPSPEKTKVRSPTAGSPPGDERDSRSSMASWSDGAQHFLPGMRGPNARRSRSSRSPSAMNIPKVGGRPRGDRALSQEEKEARAQDRAMAASLGTMAVWKRRSRKQIEQDARSALKGKEAAKHTCVHRRLTGERHYKRKTGKIYSKKDAQGGEETESDISLVQLQAGQRVKLEIAERPESGWGGRRLTPGKIGTVVVAPSPDSRFGQSFLVDFVDRQIWLKREEFTAVRPGHLHTPPAKTNLQMMRTLNEEGFDAVRGAVLRQTQELALGGTLVDDTLVAHEPNAQPEPDLRPEPVP